VIDEAEMHTIVEFYYLKTNCSRVQIFLIILFTGAAYEGVAQSQVRFSEVTFGKFRIRYRSSNSNIMIIH